MKEYRSVVMVTVYFEAEDDEAAKKHEYTEDEVVDGFHDGNWQIETDSIEMVNEDQNE